LRQRRTGFAEFACGLGAGIAKALAGDLNAVGQGGELVKCGLHVARQRFTHGIGKVAF
jgi:hypothetical protein